MSVHQRARHLDAPRRQDRDTRDQTLLWRARRAARGILDQVDDRATCWARPAASRRVSRAGRAPSDRAADHQPRRAGSGVRPRLRGRTEARRSRSSMRSRTRSASAAPTRPCCSSVTRDRLRLQDADRTADCRRIAEYLEPCFPAICNLQCRNSAIMKIAVCIKQVPDPRLAAAAERSGPGFASRMPLTR